MSKKADNWNEELIRIRRKTRAVCGISNKIQTIAEEWVGRPYMGGSLIGGPSRKERLVINLEAFDCVTFIESVLATARSGSVRGFVDELVRLRYRKGQIDWFSRLHYFSDWLKNNQAQRIVRIRTRGRGSHPIEARLSSLEDLPVRWVRFQVVPKQKIQQALPRISNGSIVGFASVRRGIDFFHTGLVFLRDNRLVLCHASRSAGKVIAEPLPDFLGRNRMRGIAFAVPREPGDPP